MVVCEPPAHPAVEPRAAAERRRNVVGHCVARCEGADLLHLNVSQPWDLKCLMPAFAQRTQYQRGAEDCSCWQEKQSLNYPCFNFPLCLE